MQILMHKGSKSLLVLLPNFQSFFNITIQGDMKMIRIAFTTSISTENFFKKFHRFDYIYL